MTRMTMNPVLGREVRERVRSGRAFVVVTVFLGLLSLVLWAVYSSQQDQRADPFGGGLMITEAASVGRTVFEWLILMMFLLVLFLVPGLTSGAVSGERERQTLVPLQITLLRPRSIVLGKLGASLAFLALLLVTSAPLVSVAYLIGGMSFTQVLGSLLAVAATGVVCAALTIGCSSVFRRTQTATVVAYGLVFFLAIGTWVGWAMWSSAMNQSNFGSSERAPTWVLAANPMAFTADVVGSGAGSASQTGPFSGMREALYPEDDLFTDIMADGMFFEDQGGVVMGPRGEVFMDPMMGMAEPMMFDEFGNPIDEPGDRRADAGQRPFWWGSGLALSILVAASLVVSARMVRTPAEKER